MSEYHEPVLLQEVLDGLITQKNGIYVDVTFGGGGHSKAILHKLDSGAKLIAFDQDLDATSQVFEDQRLTFVQANFKHLNRFLKLHGIKQVDGILADLGVSSYQFDIGARGFSYRYEGPLDMRMNQNEVLSAANILNDYAQDDLQTIFSKYGEVRNARTLAQTIVNYRNHQKINTTQELIGVIEPVARGKSKMRYFAQVFQALRIEVNQELEALDSFLVQALDALTEKGRIAVISYHSLEDRMVKNFFKTGSTEGVVKKDFYGNIFRPFKPLTKKAVIPTDQEIQKNVRAKSAKLRIAEKIIQN